MTDGELIARLREGATWDDDIAAADRIEALIGERDQHWDSFVHWRKEADALTEQLAAAEVVLKEAVEAKLDAISTLDAWFDRRELGHAAVDQAVVDAASGYLRTSRSGGMPQEESDLVLGVMQDMARLGLFADLFARAFLARVKEEIK